LPKEVLFST